MGFIVRAILASIRSLSQLLDHALVIQIPGAGEALDARQHPRIEPQRDSHGLGRLGIARRGRFHEPEVRAVLRPKHRLGIFAVEERHFFPFGKSSSRLKFQSSLRKRLAHFFLVEETVPPARTGRASSTRINRPLVRYNADDTDGRPADHPEVEKPAPALPNRGESGISRTANASSNDSSISRWVKEPSSKGRLFQSNSHSGSCCK